MLRVRVTARFSSPALHATHPAVTYDPASVPEGSRVRVVERPRHRGGDAGNVTVESLRLWGLPPSGRYDAYVYTRPCGATPAAAGRRTQDGPSTGDYAQNEVWLDFKTDPRGDAATHAAQYWPFNSGGRSRANSVVIFADATSTPVACVTVPFE